MCLTSLRALTRLLLVTANSGSVTVNTGGHLAPGDFNVGTLFLAGNMDFEGGELDIVAAGGSLNSLSIAGNLILSDAPTLNVSGSLAIGTYTIASYGGNFSGQFATPLDLATGDTIITTARAAIARLRSRSCPSHQPRRCSGPALLGSSVGRGGG